jgi:hypothetical protein
MNQHYVGAEQGMTDVVKVILRDLVRRPIGESIDDRELVVELEIVLRAFADRLGRIGTPPEQIAALRREAMDAAREAYVDLWLAHAREDEPEVINEHAEIAAAKKEFTALTRRASRL